MIKRIGRNDLIFLSVLILLSVLMVVVYRFVFSESGSKVVIRVDNKEFGSYMLGEDRVIDITDSTGNVTNRLEIKDGQANMIEAECPDHICVEHKPISLNKQTIVCLPNKVVVEVESSEESNIDTIAK